MTRHDARLTDSYRYWTDNKIHTKPVAESLAIIEALEGFEYIQGCTTCSGLFPFNCRTNTGKILCRPVKMIHDYANMLLNKRGDN